MTPALLLAAAVASAEAPPPTRVSDSLVQIGILAKARSFVFRPEGGFSVIDQKTGETRPLDDRKDYSVEAGAGGRLLFGPFLFLGQARLLPSSPEAFVQIGKQRYKGSLLVKPNPDSTLTVIHETGLEDYLFGVLPNEMSPDWPLEALKAQAVVARTFALANLGKFQSSGFDLSDDSRSQVFAGFDRQDPRATRAVRETAGEVLYWKGKLLKAFFHSCCGGHTSSISAIWGSAEAVARPLRGVPDRYCKASPHYKWSAYFRTPDILEALQEHRLLPAKLKGIRLGARDPSGFAKTLRFSVDHNTLEVRANDFRNWLGTSDLKSTKILRIVKKRKGYEFLGRGFGHGVGLCQWGAKAQADQGKSYKQILRFYFPGSAVVTRDD